MKRSIKTLATFLLALPLIAQGQSSQSSVKSLQKLKSADVPSAAMGTNSGGGGNILLGKPIDHYIFNFQNTPEYKTHVAPIMQLISRHMPDVTLTLRHTIASKVWYKVPAKLDSLPSQVIGTPFASDQGAIQTLNAVWISGLFYDAKATKAEDKALLLMHEILLGLRYSELNATYIFCQTVPGARGSENCKLIYPNPLKPQDYDQIRNAAYKLMNTQNIDARTIAEILVFNGFKIGRVEINETADSFKDLNFAQLRRLLAILANQGSFPKRGTLLSNQTPRMLNSGVKFEVSVAEGNSDETFSLTIRAPDYRVQHKVSGFTEFVYSDMTSIDNTVAYLLKSRPVNAKIGDVVPSLMLQFSGGSLVSVNVSEEMLMYSPLSNKNVWQHVDPSDVTNRPSHMFVIGE